MAKTLRRGRHRRFGLVQNYNIASEQRFALRKDQEGSSLERSTKALTLPTGLPLHLSASPAPAAVLLCWVCLTLNYVKPSQISEKTRTPPNPN